MAATELLAPVPSASEYSVSADLWERLESEIQLVSERIEKNEDLVPDDIANIRKLKNQVDAYVTSFNKAMRNAQTQYRSLVDRRLIELGFPKIEEFVAKKRQEQTNVQNDRIACKMEALKLLSDGVISRTVKLKDTAIAKELLPMFTARFPKVQSGAKTNGITDWKPYLNIISHTVSVLDTFFCDPKYEDAVHLPVNSGTIRELLAFVKDGNASHLAAVKERYKEDYILIEQQKLREKLKTKEDGLSYIRQILDDLDEETEKTDVSESVRRIRAEQAWNKISFAIRLL